MPYANKPIMLAPPIIKTNIQSIGSRQKGFLIYPLEKGSFKKTRIIIGTHFPMYDRTNYTYKELNYCRNFEDFHFFKKFDLQMKIAVFLNMRNEAAVV